MKTQHKMLVCSTCGSTWQEGKQVGVSGGEKLREELTRQLQKNSLTNQVTIESVQGTPP
jgi:predicted metal-binding protein